MRFAISVLLAGLLLTACSTDTNPLTSPDGTAGPDIGGSLAKGVAANAVMDFEDLLLLDEKQLKKILDISQKYSFQTANETYDLYPGVVFSKGLKLGYISKPDPNRPEGQLYLYGSARTTHTITFDQPVYFTSVSAKVGKLAKLVYLNVAGTHNNGNGTSEYSGVISTKLTAHPLDFKHKITVAKISLTGKADDLVLDNFEFGHNQHANNAVINTKMGFEELLELDKKVFNDILKTSQKYSFQHANEKYDLYPGIVFSSDFKLGYDSNANPGLGGQVYLYCNIGRKAYIRFLDKTVYFKSVYARVLDPKYKDPITLQLRGYGDDKQKWAADVTFLDSDLEKDLPKFDGEVNLIYFMTSGKAKQFVLDDFKFKE
ncbi:hypothetical protein ACFL5M_05135 [Candidatus Neomarinimicrobiota bacterium]